jgi:hypothetical protein
VIGGSTSSMPDADQFHKPVRRQQVRKCANDNYQCGLRQCLARPKKNALENTASMVQNIEMKREGAKALLPSHPSPASLFGLTHTDTLLLTCATSLPDKSSGIMFAPGVSSLLKTLKEPA